MSYWNITGLEPASIRLYRITIKQNIITIRSLPTKSFDLRGKKCETWWISWCRTIELQCTTYIAEKLYHSAVTTPEVGFSKQANTDRLNQLFVKFMS